MHYIYNDFPCSLFLKYYLAKFKIFIHCLSDFSFYFFALLAESLFQVYFQHFFEGSVSATSFLMFKRHFCSL